MRRSDGGRLFHIDGAATENARWPTDWGNLFKGIEIFFIVVVSLHYSEFHREKKTGLFQERCCSRNLVDGVRLPLIYESYRYVCRKW